MVDKDVIDFMKSDPRYVRMVRRCWHEKIVKTIKVFRKELSLQNSVKLTPRDLVSFIRNIMAKCMDDFDTFVYLEEAVNLTVDECLNLINSSQVKTYIVPYIRRKIVKRAMNNKGKPVSW